MRSLLPQAEKEQKHFVPTNTNAYMKHTFSECDLMTSKIHLHIWRHKIWRRESIMRKVNRNKYITNHFALLLHWWFNVFICKDGLAVRGKGLTSYVFLFLKFQKYIIFTDKSIWLVCTQYSKLIHKYNYFQTCWTMGK